MLELITASKNRWDSPLRWPCRFMVVFNPLEQERLSIVSLLVNTPRIRVLNEEGQPLAVQLSAHWNSATDTAPDIYQVGGSGGGGLIVPNFHG